MLGARGVRTKYFAGYSFHVQRLKPIADTLKKMGTNLGIWFGPTGGYSFRMKRVSWMKQHGYEVVGETRDNAMLCLAGKNYSQLFEKRVTDMVRNDGMAYFKWDGIQFSCSEPDHGHSTGIYSRRAVLESVIDKCKAVRTVNPDVYLNITSGTWLSPWWVKYANQITPAPARRSRPGSDRTPSPRAPVRSGSGGFPKQACAAQDRPTPQASRPYCPDAPQRRSGLF